MRGRRAGGRSSRTSSQGFFFFFVGLDLSAGTNKCVNHDGAAGRTARPRSSAGHERPRVERKRDRRGADRPTRRVVRKVETVSARVLVRDCEVACDKQQFRRRRSVCVCVCGSLSLTSPQDSLFFFKSIYIYFKFLAKTIMNHINIKTLTTTFTKKKQK